MNKLKNKVIVVTGGSGLLGRQIINSIVNNGGIAVNLDVNSSEVDDFIECDITNNNSNELHMTLNEIKEKNIQYEPEEYYECLDSYISTLKYPKNVDSLYIKINNMVNDDYYTGNVLIEYTSKVYNI